MSPHGLALSKANVDVFVRLSTTDDQGRSGRGRASQLRKGGGRIGESGRCDASLLLLEASLGLQQLFLDALLPLKES